MFDHGSLIPLLLLLAALGTAGGLCAWWIRRETTKGSQLREQMEQAQQARDIAKCEAIEEGLREWLKMLELPQFEEQTKLQEAARQLRIVLVERLLRGPRVR